MLLLEGPCRRIPRICKHCFFLALLHGLFRRPCRSAVPLVSTTSSTFAMTHTRGRSSSPWRPASCRRCPSTSTSPPPIASSDAMPRCVLWVWGRPFRARRALTPASGGPPSLGWVFAVLSVQCVSAGMDTLTLARYYCEMSLMEMEMVSERGSLLASACLLMALVTKDLGGWVGPAHGTSFCSDLSLLAPCLAAICQSLGHFCTFAPEVLTCYIWSLMSKLALLSNVSKQLSLLQLTSNQKGWDVSQVFVFKPFPPTVIHTPHSCATGMFFGNIIMARF